MNLGLSITGGQIVGVLLGFMILPTLFRSLAPRGQKQLFHMMGALGGAYLGWTQGFRVYNWPLAGDLARLIDQALNPSTSAPATPTSPPAGGGGNGSGGSGIIPPSFTP